MQGDYTQYESLSRYNVLDPALSFYHVGAKQLPEDAERLDRLRWHEEIEVKLILSGQAEILCGPRVFIAGPGDVVIINSCEMHGIRQHGDAPPVYHLLMLPRSLPVGETALRLLAPAFEGKCRFDEVVHGDEALREIIEQLFAALKDMQHAYELEATGYLSLFLARLLQRYAHWIDDQLPMQKYAEKLRPAIDYIYQHYREDIRVEELAQACSLSMYYFCRLFKLGTGYTVAGYVNHFRLSKAAALLSATDLSVAAVAEAVGFRDESYFSRCFKNWSDCSPAKYREIKRAK